MNICCKFIIHSFLLQLASLHLLDVCYIWTPIVITAGNSCSYYMHHDIVLLGDVITFIKIVFKYDVQALDSVWNIGVFYYTW